MNEGWAQSVVEQIAADVRSDLESAGPDMVRDWKDLISVPVEYRGGYIIRSSPGEPPRRETGRLQNSLDWAIDPDGSLAAYSTIFYSAYLQDGTGRMLPRPHASVIFDQWSDSLVDRLLSTYI